MVTWAKRMAGEPPARDSQSRRRWARNIFRFVGGDIEHHPGPAQSGEALGLVAEYLEKSWRAAEVAVRELRQQAVQQFSRPGVAEHKGEPQ